MARRLEKRRAQRYASATLNFSELSVADPTPTLVPKRRHLRVPKPSVMEASSFMEEEDGRPWKLVVHRRRRSLSEVSRPDISGSNYSNMRNWRNIGSSFFHIHGSPKASPVGRRGPNLTQLASIPCTHTSAGIGLRRILGFTWVRAAARTRGDPHREPMAYRAEEEGAVM